MTAPWTAQDLTVADLTFDALRVGPADGDTILLLHGFPESNAQWRDVGPVLADAGFAAIAPNLRGYAPGARPQGVANYTVDKLAADVIAMAEQCSAAVHLVGHDWGGIVGWFAAGRRPDLFATYTAVSTAHPQATALAAANDPEQREKMAYIKLLRQEGVAEEKLTADDWALLREMVSDLPGEKIDEHLQLLGQPGALTAALNYYRAYEPARGMSLGAVQVPTAYVWGNRDVAFGRTAAEGTRDFVDAPYEFVELDEGHWISDVRPDELADIILRRVRG